MKKNEKNSKIEEMSVEELVKYVNSRYADKKNKATLAIIAAELETNISKIQTTLATAGYKFKAKQYVKINKEAQNKKIQELDMMYLISEDFNASLTCRINKKTHADFLEFCKENFPSLSSSRLVSLALKEFVENHK